jgi:hypothetical protein
LRLRLANAPEAARCIDEADNSMRPMAEESLALISSSFRIERASILADEDRRELASIL